MELFERVAEADARLLKVERRADRGAPDDETLAAGFLLVFDVARILVEPAPRGDGLVASPVESVDPAEGWVSADEEEPWWRLRGHPLVRCRGDGRELALQFRPDDEAPRTLTLALEKGHLRVSLRPDALSA